MEYALQISSLGILLILFNINDSFSLKCFECENCPDPFKNTSSVRTRDQCAWCAKILVKTTGVINRECAPKCEFDYWAQKYKSLSYYCCQTEYCNKNIQTRTIHQILLIFVITLTCFFIIEKK
ncbi:unnamed protein product [Schistosoma turkestanicum]|nr:unnamed protein product [Schistosoma turkestanicum]